MLLRALAIVAIVGTHGNLLDLTGGAHLLLVLMGAPAAYACRCAGYNFEEAAESADLLADITIQHEIVGHDGDITYLAVVDTVWKGEESRTIEFTTQEQTTACGLGRLPEGTSLLVWARGESGSYSSSWCALPKDGGEDDRERLTELLGEPADLTDQPIPEPERPPLAERGWVIASLSVAALGVWVLVARMTVLTVVLVQDNRRQRRPD